MVCDLWDIDTSVRSVAGATSAAGADTGITGTGAIITGTGTITTGTRATITDSGISSARLREAQ